MSILNVDKIQPIGSGSTVTVNATDTILTNAQAGIITATEFHGTLAVGTSVTYGDNEKAYFGNGLDLQIYHAAGAASHINNTGLINIDGTTGVRLEYNNSTRVDCTTSGVSLVGDVDVADKIIHTGDTNTAIRFPAADTVAVETAGTERLRIQSDGTVRFYNSIYGGDNKPIYLGNSNDLSLFHDSGGASIIRYNHSVGGLHFRNNSNADQMVIDSSGRVLIGTTTEGAANADELTISYNNTGVGGGDQGRCGLTIRSGQNTSSVMQNGYIYFSDGTSGGNEYRGVVGYSHSDDSMYFSTAETARLRITSAGDFGTNGVTPTTQSGRVFHLHAGSHQQRFHMTNNTTGSSATDGFEIIVEESANVRIRNFEAGALMFDTGGSNNEAFRIDSSGKLLLGDTTTAWNSNSNDYKMSIKESSSENAAIMFLDTDSMRGGICGIAKGTNQILSGTTNVDFVLGSTYSDTHIISGDGTNVANAAIRMTVHRDGYVTTPINPKFFYVGLSNSNSSSATTSSEYLKFATEKHNQGSNYNTSNGRFTAPVAGTYWFSFNGLVDNSGSNAHYWAQLHRNGSSVAFIGYTFSNNGEYEYFGGSACIYLAKDDYAQIYASSNIHVGGETSFSGYLIG